MESRRLRLLLGQQGLCLRRLLLLQGRNLRRQALLLRLGHGLNGGLPLSNRTRLLLLQRLQRLLLRLLKRLHGQLQCLGLISKDSSAVCCCASCCCKLDIDCEFRDWSSWLPLQRQLRQLNLLRLRLLGWHLLQQLQELLHRQRLNLLLGRLSLLLLRCKHLHRLHLLGQLKVRLLQQLHLLQRRYAVVIRREVLAEDDLLVVYVGVRPADAAIDHGDADARAGQALRPGCGGVDRLVVVVVGPGGVAVVPKLCSGRSTEM